MNVSASKAPTSFSRKPLLAMVLRQKSKSHLNKNLSKITLIYFDTYLKI
jgi:hypothetical protein